MCSQNWMLNNKKKILLSCLCSGLLLSWYTFKATGSRPSLNFPCTLDRYTFKATGSRPSLNLSFTLDRMLYDEPDILKPQRRDVLTVSPWMAPIVWQGTFNKDLLNAQFHQIDVRVGLTVFAIKKYVRFLNKFIESAEKFFMVGHKVNYYVFTDRANEISNFTLAEGRQLVILEVPAYERWQDVSMRRMEMIRDFSIKRFVNEVDYLACVDVDMVFLDYVGVEILSKVFGALHPGFFDKTRREFTYERRPQSSAYIPFEAGDFYYAGGYFGGVIEEVVRLTNYCHQAMMADKQKNMEALWHDESYLNKYFLLHKPTKILSPEYIWNNYYGSPAAVQTKRFLGVDKNYEEVRF
ncbi:histo-blood group ABO system transferase-like isoform X1 [Hyla sarda]|uniref:histo-blood group ABO system transferase-like isoform X1 n=2 Tax=Hyla sarda TaxID=327740 RepID=UPI0024C429B6|nr:histo-blood group ABO system transferase-like isoform X1 [Hyla sarda]